ncbi:carbohydrate esterase family 1 protein [Planoprotostelium fungivorum]|uniref:Carbohydrate esterase family 1 protein n=1 Tax=Planoprotostelium fungivorum TaxID=1890364 RepID=A0A2P6NVE4_9EUKA|nr:carbohydrate esterase family 1 protein [Planoprotostelium fungivorum]
MRQPLLLFALISIVIASSGCGKAYIAKGYQRGVTKDFTLSTSGQPTRSYSVHLPPNYSKDTQGGHPLVFSFHGATQTSKIQEDISDLSANGLEINNKSFVAVYPQGVNGIKGTSAWTGAPYANSNVDDVAFVLKMMSVLTSDLCIDEDRIYATGKSNGGGFANYLACTPSTASKLAAIATASAAIYTNHAFGPNNNCNPGRGFPIIDFHGTTDDTIKYDGGRSNNADYLSSDNFFNGWGKRDNCTNPNQQTLQDGAVTIRKWSGCKNTSLVRHFKINGMDHAWPRTTLPAKCNGKPGNNDCDKTVINANDYLLPFFSQFALSTTKWN